MRNPVRNYDWGSTTALARLQNRPPSGLPEAELWIGAHPAAPSDILLDLDSTADGVGLSGPDAGRLPLPAAIALAPQAVLGPKVMARFGSRLPFMLKLLAIERPLSVQVHPGAARAAEVYHSEARREAGTEVGLEVGALYTDPYAKPELLIALEPVEALFGFRTAAQAGELIGRLGCERLTGLVEALRAPADGGPADGRPEEDRLRDALASLLRWPLVDRAGLVAEIAAGSARLLNAGSQDYREAFGWVDRLVGLHPADPMVLAPLLLELLKVTPGQSVFVPAGVPHCYLSGLAIEVLAASDNVLRCGLTSKPIAVQELLRVIDCRPSLPASCPPVRLSDVETAWRPEVSEFQLAFIRVLGDGAGDQAGGILRSGDEAVSGPQIILCTRGSVSVHAAGRCVALGAGESAFAGADAGPIAFSGEGDIYRAAPGLHDLENFVGA